MNVTFDLSEQNAEVLEAQARAADLPTAHYLARIVEQVLHTSAAAGQAELPLRKPKKSAWGLLAKYGPGPTEEEINENRREMFRGFGDLAP